MKFSVRRIKTENSCCRHELSISTDHFHQRHEWCFQSTNNCEEPITKDGLPQLTDKGLVNTEENQRRTLYYRDTSRYRESLGQQGHTTRYNECGDSLGAKVPRPKQVQGHPRRCDRERRPVLRQGDRRREKDRVQPVRKRRRCLHADPLQRGEPRDRLPARPKPAWGIRPTRWSPVRPLP